MTPDKIELFLGLPITKELAALIDSLPAEKRDLYIQPSKEYLSEVTVDNKRYIGKSCGEKVDFDSIQLVETNILSLLRKLEIHPQDSTLTLFPLNCYTPHGLKLGIWTAPKPRG